MLHEQTNDKDNAEDRIHYCVCKKSGEFPAIQAIWIVHRFNDIGITFKFIECITIIAIDAI